MDQDRWVLSRREALALFGAAAAAGTSAHGVPVQSPAPAPASRLRLWTWDEPAGASRADPRIKPLVRIAVDKDRGDDAAGKVGMRALQLGVPSGSLAILLQNFGMGGGPPDGAAWRRLATTSLFMHPSDALPDRRCDAPWLTPWFRRGIAQTKPWFTQFADRLAQAVSRLPNLPAPTRFHFDSEEWPQVVSSAQGSVGAFIAMMDDPRWSEEPIEGFGVPMSTLWDRGGRLKPSPERTWFHVANRDWACWYQGVLFTASAAALASCVGEAISSRWPDCLWSNYVLSSSFDGVEDRFDVDPRNPWLKTVHRSHSPMQAPNLYPIPSAWSAGRGMRPTPGALEYHRIMLDRMARSYDGTPPSRFSPWIEGIQEREEGGERLVSDRDYMRGVLSLLHDRSIEEALLWNDPGTTTPAFWAGLPGLIDEAVRA